MKKKCEKCEKEFEVDEKSAKWKKLCIDCFRNSKEKEKNQSEDEVQEANKQYNVRTTVDRHQLRIWKGQCFNAAIELAKLNRLNVSSKQGLDWIFDLAERLYQRGLGREFLSD